MTDITPARFRPATTEAPLFRWALTGVCLLVLAVLENDLGHVDRPLVVRNHAGSEVAVGAEVFAADDLEQPCGTVVQVGFGNLTSSLVTTALGFTPYNSTNPSGFITSSGSITGAAGSCTGNAATASKWATGRTIALTGDVTGTSAAFDGSAALSFAATLASSGVAAGTYSKVTVDAKGRVTTGASIVSGDVTGALGFTPANKAGDPNADQRTKNGPQPDRQRRCNELAGRWPSLHDWPATVSSPPCCTSLLCWSRKCWRPGAGNYAVWTNARNRIEP